MIELVQLSLPALEALAAGDLARANAVSPVVLTPYMLERRSVWVRRAKQVAADPACAPWVTGVVVDETLGVVGTAGFHEPPDAEGRVEIGYAIDPSHRRRGFARATVELLVERAQCAPAVRTVRACISPTNAASRAVIAAWPFQHVGEVMDEEDGPEQVWELAIRP